MSDDYGRQVRQQLAEAQERIQLLEAGVGERAAMLEHARDLLEEYGAHGNDWPAIAPAIQHVLGELAAARADAERWEQARDAECLATARVFHEYYRRWQSTIVEARRQHARAEQAEAERDGAYRERAQLLAWLATLNPAVLAPAPDVDEPGWQILYVTAGGHQLSWHIHPRDADLYAHVEQVPADDPRAQGDGHTTAQKYDRIRSLSGATL